MLALTLISANFSHNAKGTSFFLPFRGLSPWISAGRQTSVLRRCLLREVRRVFVLWCGL